jgi:hypothetical protein
VSIRNRTPKTKPTASIAAKEPGACGVADASGDRVNAVPTPALNAEVLVVDDYEREIQKYYSMSRRRAVEVAKKAGILTPGGRLSGSYK